MPIQTQMSVKVENSVIADVMKEIHNILILTEAEDNIYWQVWTWHDGKVIKKEAYNFPFVELAAIKTKGREYVVEIEETLWKKTDEIDSMPTSTLEEQRAKSERYGKFFEYHINR